MIDFRSVNKRFRIRRINGENIIRNAAFSNGIWNFRAKKKPIDNISIDELGIDIIPRNKQLRVTQPPKREKGIMVKDVAELVHKLKYEAKVI